MSFPKYLSTNTFTDFVVETEEYALSIDYLFYDKESYENHIPHNRQKLLQLSKFHAFWKVKKKVFF